MRSPHPFGFGGHVVGMWQAHGAALGGVSNGTTLHDVCPVQAPVRDAIARHGSAVQQLVEEDLRPIRLRDFQVRHGAKLFCA